MKPITKARLKELLSQNENEQVVEQLFNLFSWFTENHRAKEISEYNHRFNLLSRKLNKVDQEINLGQIDSEFAALEYSLLNHGFSNLINKIPDQIFIQRELAEQARKKSSGFAQDNFKFDVFLSFSSEDREFAKKIWEELNGHGLKTFLSDISLKTNVGQSFFEKIQNALVNSKHFVLVCTSNSMKSEWVKTEYETFYNEFHLGSRAFRKLIILKGEGFEMSQVPVLLRRLQMAERPQQIIESIVGSESSNITSKGRFENESYTNSVALSQKKRKSNPELFKNELLIFFETFKEKPGFHLPPDISDKQLKNAIAFGNLSDAQDLIALIDTTVFKSAKAGMVFTNEGIHYHNPSNAKQKGTFFIEYTDFNNRQFSFGNLFKNWVEIVLDKDGYFYYAGCPLEKEDIVAILNGVKELVIKHL